MKRGIPVVVLIGLMVAPLGCGGKQQADQPREIVVEDIESAKDRIEKHIDDKELEAHLLLLVDENALILLQVQQAFVDLGNELETHPEMTREELEPLYLAYTEERRALFEELVAVQMAVRGLLTPEQWELVFPSPKEKKGDKQP